MTPEEFETRLDAIDPGDLHAHLALWREAEAAGLLVDRDLADMLFLSMSAGEDPHQLDLFMDAIS